MIQFSVITVCLNAENCIRDTIQSVLNQTASDFEYIIKDGLSTDETVSIAQSFTAAFAEKCIPYRIISQKDTGIYDAMNQAILETQGEWLIFMNAGDCFANNSVLDQVDNSGCLVDTDIVYGDRILQNHGFFLYYKARALEDIRYTLPFGHQSVFTNRKLFEANLYPLQYRICGDYKFYLQMYLEGKKFVYYPNAVSIYDVNGLSSNWEMTLLERIRILEEMPLRDEDAIQKKKNEWKFRQKKKHREILIHQCLGRFVPKNMREKRWKYKREKAGWKTAEEFFGHKQEQL